MTRKPTEAPEVAAESEHGRHHLRGFFGRDLVYTILWASQMGLATLLTAVVTRILGPSDYGIAAASITIMQLVSAIGGFGLQLGVQRAHAHAGDEAARRLITLALMIAAGVYVIVAATGPLWAGLVGLAGFAGAPHYAVAWAACTAGTSATLGLLRSRDQLARFAIVNVLQTALAELLSLLLILLVARSASEYILGELLGQAAALVAGLGLTRPLLLRARDASLALSAIVFCAPLVPATVANFVLSASDRLVVNAFVGHDALARYAVANNIGSIPAILITSLAASWMPRVFSLSRSPDLAATLRRARDVLYLLLMPILVFIGVGSPLLLRIWAPASFDPNSLQLEVALITVASIPLAAASTHQRLLLARDHSRPTATATIVAALVNLGLTLAIVPAIGILGAALATLVAVCVLDLMLARSAGAIAKLQRPNTGTLLWIAVGTAMIFAAVALPTTAPFLILRVVVAVIVGAVAVVIAIWFARGEQARVRHPVAVWLANHADLGRP